jgi:DNA-binding CsgD family transcriptional regulator
VLILGEAGVGKTRLVHEFCARAADAGALVLEGGCMPLPSGPIPFLPLTAALRALTRALPAAEVRVVLGPAQADLTPLLPELGIPDAAESPAPEGPLGRARLFETILGVAERLTERRPVILAIEDLQWADRSTLDLLVFLVASLRIGKVLLIATCRAEALHERADLLQFVAELDRRPAVERIELRPFSRRELAEQFKAVTGRPPRPSELGGLLVRSGGNPFLAEQLLTALLAHPGEMAAPTEATIPAALDDIVAAKLARLTPEAQWIVRVAAIAGGPVSAAVLESAASRAGDRGGILDFAVREAIDAGILDAHDDPSGEEILAFRHDLLRELAGRPRPRSEEQRIHASYAELLAARAPMDPASIIRVAHHWYEAGEAERALPATVTAAEAAERLFAFAEASLQYSRALELWDRVRAADDRVTVDRVDLLQRAGEAELLAGDATRAVELLREAIDEPAVNADAGRASVLHGRLRVALWQAGSRAEAIGDAETALASISAAEGSVERALAESHLAALLMETGEIERSLEMARSAANTARAAGATREEALALGTVGADLIQLGRLSEGLDQIRAVWRRTIELGQALGIAIAIDRLTEALDETARYEEAVVVGEQGLDTARRMGLAHSFAPFVAAALADALERLGRWDEAWSLCRETADGVLPTSARQRLDGVAARIATRRGRFAEADELIAAISPEEANGEMQQSLEVLQLERRIMAPDRDDVGNGSVRPDGATPVAASARWRQSIGDLVALLARADADAAERARAMRDEAGREDAARRARGRVRVLERLRRDATPEVGALIEPYELLAAAEAARARTQPRRGDAVRWSEARRAWHERDVPYVAAYAALRETECLLAAGGPRPEAERLVQEALATATALGADPLRAEVESVARRGRLSTQPSGAAEPDVRPAAQAADRLGLTPREREILGYVAAGWTNRQMAEALFISPKTASVHVSHILDKLGVEGRVQAATIGVRLGLADAVPPEPASPRRAR